MEEDKDTLIGWSRPVGKRAPNVLTGLRFLAVPIFVLLLINPTPENNWWAMAIFVLASITDWLDGFLARVYKAESILGKLMDPLADKVLVTAALIMLCADPTGPRVPAWLVVVLLSRDLLVTGLRSLAAVKGTVVAASVYAKHKTFWTMVAIAFLLVGQKFELFGITIDALIIGTWLLWFALFLSISTGVHYAVVLRKLFWEEDK